MLAPRLRMAATANDTISVDGVWWPRSDVLATELPELLEALAHRLGPIHRVIYHLDEWATAPAKLTSAGRRVRLDGFRHKPTHTIDVLDIDGSAIALLIIPPGTNAAAAHTVMTTAADPAASTVEDLMTITMQDAHGDAESVAAEQQWDSEGGAATHWDSSSPTVRATKRSPCPSRIPHWH